MKRNKKSFEGYRANKNERPLTIAHRGASALAEHENTLESFQIAIDIGADMVEFDVRKTSDDVLIVDMGTMNFPSNHLRIRFHIK